jgi:multidrug efflux system membrane fusion protein
MLPVPVTVSEVVRKAVPVQLRVIGNVQPLSTVAVKPQVSGQVVSVHFTGGQEVRKGALLFTVDPRPFEAALRQAEANLERDRAQLRQAVAALSEKMAARKQAEAVVARDEAQLEHARVQEKRYEELVQKEFVAKEQYEQVRTNARALEATVQAGRAAVDNAKAAAIAAQAAIANVEAAIRANEAAVETARLQLGYCSIRSPIDGRAGDVLVHAGNVVKANPDTPLLVINEVRPINVTFAVPDQYLDDVKGYRAAGPLRVEAVAPNQGKPPARGTVTFVNNTVDPGTGTIQLKAIFPNTDNVLWPGQFVDVVVTLTSEPDAIVVPSQAIQTGQKGTYVFVVKRDLTVESRPVTVGRTIDRETVVARGLAAGERVVTDGQVRLVPGAKVDIRPAAAAAAPAAAAKAR